MRPSRSEYRSSVNVKAWCLAGYLLLPSSALDDEQVRSVVSDI
jgi:hypothetical protein